MIIERLFAAIALTFCVLLLVRLLIGERRRARVDAALQRGLAAARRAASWPGRRRAAARAAKDAIKRARAHGQWDGNVYTHGSFRKPRRDKMH
jgi:hypothetical protein